MMKKYHGSCACGAVKFESEVDLSAGTFKCNCSYCSKIRFWGLRVPKEAIRITAGGEKVSRWGEKKVHHFCSVCGTKLFGIGEKGAVNLAALDDLDPREWAAVPVRYVDGKNDNWQGEPEFKGHLN